MLEQRRAVGTRRMKRDRLNSGTEFTYDFGHQTRFVHFGGWGSGVALKYDVPVNFSKKLRFRTVYTGGWLTAWAYWPGVTSFRPTDSGGAFAQQNVYGTELGRFWSGWSPTSGGNNTVTWTSQCSGNCASAVDMAEWRVWETGAAQFNTQLRFPGQYHDAETDLFENWNRFYDPTTGRYLSPEPLLQSPAFVAGMAGSGLQTPAYSYGANNPVAYVDEDGRTIRSANPSTASQIRVGWAVSELLRNPKIGGDLARLMYDPQRTAFLDMPPYGPDSEGGGRTTDPFRTSDGTGCQSVASPESHNNFLRNARPPVANWLPAMSPSALAAHELGHSFSNFYGGDGYRRSIDWENAVRSGEGSPLRPTGDHLWPRQPFFLSR